MGLYWAATGLGNKVAGLIGQASEELGEFEIFTGIAVVWSIIGLLVIAMLKPLKRLAHGADDGDAKMSNDISEGFELTEH